MAGPIRGSIEHYLNGTGLGSASLHNVFVNAYNFFNNNTGTLGIQRIAYHTGSKSAGMSNTRGMNYWDMPDTVGENAWACFRFLSASVPFDMLIQWTASTAFGTAPGSPGLLDNAAATNVLGIAVAQRLDHSGSWNGTTNNDGKDTKGTPVWTSGSSVGIFYPRSNDPIRAGAHGVSKQNCLGFSMGLGVANRAHFIADYDNFVMLYDNNADNSYITIGFGIYTPVSGLNVDVPYFMYSETSVVYPDPAATYGSAAGGAKGGGLSFPNVAVSGTCTFAPDYTSTFALRGSTTYQPNRAWPTPRWDESPFWIALAEAPLQTGVVGQHGDFIRFVYNIATHDTNAAGTRAIFGDTTLANSKISVPWHSGTVPGTGVTREGTQFGM